MIADQETGYRRGVLLGLTMAEVVILTIMAILLSMAALTKELTEERDAAREASKGIEHITEAEKQIVRVLGVPPGPVDETWQEITNRVTAMTKELAGLAERESRLEDLESRNSALIETLRETQEKLDQAEAHLDPVMLEKAEVGAAVMAASGATEAEKVIERCEIGSAMASANPSITPTAAASMAAVEGELKSCKGQVNNLIRTRGGTLPPCWVSDDGRPLYAFDVILTDSGLTIRDTRPRDRRNEVAADVTFDSVLSRQAFLRQTRPFFDHSRKQDPECRFYVRQIDKTGSDKKTFNDLRLTVENHFYKYEVRR